MVGYQANDTVVKVNKNFVMLAPSFLSVSDGTLSTDQIICDQTVTSYDVDADDFVPGWDEDAAVIQVPDGYGSYLWRYYIDDADDGKGNYVTGWADDAAMLNTLDIDLGTGIWVRGKKDTVTKFTFAGQVSGNVSETVARENPIRFELVANPFPTAMNVNSDKITWDVTPVTSYDIDADDFVEGWDNEAAVIQVPDGYGSYLWRYYIDDADDGKGNYVTGWADDAAMLNDLTIPAGCGFWLRRCGKDGASAWSFTTTL